MPKTWAISGVDLHLDVAGTRRRAAVESALRDAVRSGRLGPGLRLPSSRSLAADLGIARNTVAAAYAQLVAEGWLEARRGAGTRVAARRLPGKAAVPAEGDRARPARYDLRAGAPDVAAFPRAAWLTAARRALRVAPPDVFGYPDPRGRPELRHALAEYLARARGVDVNPDRVVICSGFAQGLALVCRALRDRGARRVALESYGHASHRAAVTGTGLQATCIPVDADGAAVAELDTADADAVVLTPAHQFPLGSTLAAPRRLRAVESARETGGLVIEDDYDGEFRFDRQPLGAMQALAPDLVVYAGTASKSLAPGLRLGWLVLPESLLEAVLEARLLTDGPSALEQLTLAELIVTGAYDRQVRRSRLVYRRRRDRLVTALRRDGSGARVTGVEAGLHAVVELPAGRAEGEAVADGRARGVMLEGVGAYRLGEQQHPPSLVVGYATPPEHAFSAALARLCAVLAR